MNPLLAFMLWVFFFEFCCDCDCGCCMRKEVIVGMDLPLLCVPIMDRYGQYTVALAILWSYIMPRTCSLITHIFDVSER